MRAFGQLLLALGVVVGVGVVLALFGRVGVPAVHWMVNLGLAKLALVASGSLLWGGAVSIRLAERRRLRLLQAGTGQE